ncbi:MAG: hypothetical protein F4X99_18015 [Gammaproteobacteria bacterium]|nr:hypothetical protein [Gammaproteobacteria bacterium]MYE81771.1 hypothetical protein [Gammaproteobacteria bacterium]
MKLDDSMESVREMLGGLHRSGTALIKKGTAMGPLIPLVLLVPVLGLLAWAFKDVAVFAAVPWFSAICLLLILVIIGTYVWHYSTFARKDPDRLQSERYRVWMEQLEVQRVQAKEGLIAPETQEPPSRNPEALDSDAESADVGDERKERRE